MAIMKAILFILFFGFCLTKESLKVDVECKCRLRYNFGKTLEKFNVPNDSLTVSNTCNGTAFNACAEACNQTISNQTNGFDLYKPKVGDTSNTSLGQLYCNQIGFDVSSGKLFLSVTLECDIEQEVQQDVNGNTNIGSMSSQTAITRFVKTGFNQNLRCLDHKFVESTTESTNQ